MTPMKCYEHFRMKLDFFPLDIIDKYDLTNKVDHSGNVHCKVRRGMYKLPQTEIIAQELLKERLLKAGYSQSKITPGYWKHEWRPISFTLVVDDFGVKYIGKDHAMHLIKSLKEHYEVEEDWDRRCYVGVRIDWTIATEKSTFQCQSMLNGPMHHSDTPSQTSPSTNHTNMQSPHMEPRSNMQNLKTRRNAYPPPRRNSSKR